MKLKNIVENLKLNVIAGDSLLDREVSGGYVSDMLSDVIAHSSKGDLWVTLQTHLNIIAVASMKELSAILIVNNRRPDEETLKKAVDEKIPVLNTEMNAFQVVGKLYQLGIRGQDEDV
ncbi:MAG: DRTGG domain-containing protein [Candidatus Hydrogenedentota bacterium]